MENIFKILGFIIALIIVIVAIVLVVDSDFGKNVGVDPNAISNEQELNEVENDNVVENNDTTGNGIEEISSAEDLSKLIDNIYAKQTMEMPMLMTQALDMEDEETLKYMTGLEDVSDLEYVVASEPMMSSQAYSLILAKVKEDADVEKIAKEMNENVDIRKWICVAAEMVYTTSYDDVVFLVMSRDELAKPIYDTFKDMAGTIGKEYERVGEIQEDMPVEDMPAL